jgi:hypothetical protein
MDDIKWHQKEKAIARVAFDKALHNESNHIVESLKEKLNDLSDPKDVWRLEDYLSKKRKQIYQKYDFRYSILIMVLGVLVKEGWIEIKDLDGLDEEKLQKIRSIAEGLEK